MRILVDECVPRSIKRFLTGHFVRTVQQAGYTSYKNGDLLKAAEHEFDILITSDKNLRYQQNLSGRKLAILLLSTNNRTAIELKADLVLRSVNLMRPREFRELEL